MGRLTAGSRVWGYALCFATLFSASAFGEGLAEPVTLESVLQYVQQHPEVRTIDDFLSRLPVSYRSQFTLMHTSNSLQTATPEMPRGILFGPDGKLLMAFASDPSKDRFDSLELIGFHADGARFEFREIRFPEQDASKKAAEISEANPALCLRCHRADPRPNWEHYHTWPGAFASEDDEFSTDSLVSQARLEKFLDGAATAPRFRNLDGLKDSYHSEGGRTRVEHNIHMTERVAVLNFLRIARLARQSPQWQQYKYAALGAVWCGPKMADFLPPALQGKFSPYYEKLKGNGSFSTADNLGVHFAARAIPIADWYLDFVSTGKDASFGTPGWPFWELSGPLVEGDTDLTAFFTVSDQAYEGASFRKADLKNGEGSGCDAMAKRSLDALNTLAR